MCATSCAKAMKWRAAQSACCTASRLAAAMGGVLVLNGMQDATTSHEGRTSTRKTVSSRLLL